MAVSSGLLVFRFSADHVPEVLLVHPGGPFFTQKDKGWLTIPKGIPEKGESLQNAAMREFEEETGHKIPLSLMDKFVDLGEVRQKGGKIVHAFALRHDIPENWKFRSNTFQLEWPVKSGTVKEFPEMDKAEFFAINEAFMRINLAQAAFLQRLLDFIQGSGK